MTCGVTVIWDPFAYLSQSELSRIDEQFDGVLQNETCLVFWTGLDRSLVQRWADRYGLKTLVGALGPLFDSRDPNSPRNGKSTKRWSKYMKGASGRFAEYACKGRRAVVLTSPPPGIYSARKRSTFRYLEEPILKGTFGGPKTIRIDYVHPSVDAAAEFLYQTWPANKSSEWAMFRNNILQKKLEQKAVDYTPFFDECDKNRDCWSGKKVEDEQNMGTKKDVKRRKVEEERNLAQERGNARWKKAEEQQTRAEEKRETKQRKEREQQELAQEKRDAKRRKVEEQQRQAQEKRGAKRKKAEEQQSQVQARREAKQRKVEEQQKKTQENMVAKHV